MHILSYSGISLAELAQCELLKSRTSTTCLQQSVRIFLQIYVFWEILLQFSHMTIKTYRKQRGVLF